MNQVFVTTIVFFSFGFFGISEISAQMVDVPAVGGDPTINITAQVLGCGDDVTQTILGEQCDGIDLNSQTCNSIGFDSGVLGCRTSCIFDTSLCISENGSSGGSVQDVTGIFDQDVIPDTNLSFSGYTEPGSWVVIQGNGNYLISIQVETDGTFFVAVTDPIPDDYDFTFYSISTENGISGPVYFSTEVPENLTTHVINIFIPYGTVQEIPIEPELPVDLEVIDTINENNPDPIDADLYAQFLDILSQSENLSPDELRALIKAFSEQNGYEAQVPGYSKEGLKLGLLPYLQRQWGKLPEVGRKWYPNVYISFMEPYRIFFYEMTDWYKEQNNPFWKIW